MTVTKSSLTHDSKSSETCVCTWELRSGEGLLEDVVIKSSSRIQEIYVRCPEAKGDEESYVATCRGVRENPNVDIFISHLPPNSGLRRFSSLIVKFLSIKGPSSESLLVHHVSVKLHDLRLIQSSQPVLPGPSPPQPKTSGPDINPSVISSILGQVAPSMHPNESTSTKTFSSDYDTFTLFAMYKSMLMAEVGQMLDTKLAPISSKLFQLDKRMEDMQQQLHMCQQREVSEKASGKGMQHGNMVASDMSNVQQPSASDDISLYNSEHYTKDDIVKDLVNSPIALDIVQNKKIPEGIKQSVSGEDCDYGVSNKLQDENGSSKYSSDEDDSFVIDRPRQRDIDGEIDVELMGDMKRLLGFVKESDSSDNQNSDVAITISKLLPRVE